MTSGAVSHKKDLEQVEKSLQAILDESNGTNISYEYKLSQVRNEYRENSVKLRLEFEDFRTSNPGQESFSFIEKAISTFIEATTDSIKKMEDVFSSKLASENNLKTRVVSTALFINENNDKLKNEVQSLTKKLNDIGKGIDSPEQEVLRLRKIVGMKEKIIKKLKMTVFYKTNFFSLKQFDLLNSKMEMGKILTHFDQQLRSKIDLIRRTYESISTVSDPMSANLLQEIGVELQNVTSVRAIEESIDQRIRGFPPLNEQVKNLMQSSRRIIQSSKEISKNKDIITKLNDKISSISRDIDDAKCMKSAAEGGKLSEKENEIALNKAKIRELENINLSIKKELLNCRIEIIKSHSSTSQRLKLIRHLAKEQISQMENDIKKTKHVIDDIKKRYFNNTISSMKNIEIIGKFKDLYKLNSLFRRVYSEMDELESNQIKEPGAEPPKKEEQKPMDFKNKNRVQELQSMVKQREQAMKTMGELSETLKQMNNKLMGEIEHSQMIQDENRKMSTGLALMKGQLQETFNELKNLEQERERLEANLNEKDEKLLKCIREINDKKKAMEKIQKERASMKEKIKQNEEELRQKDNLMKEMADKLADIGKKNEELKRNLDLQLKKMEEICQDSFAKYELIEDLLKQKKIFDQIFKHQNEKIQAKDDKIKLLEGRLMHNTVSKNSAPKTTLLRSSGSNSGSTYTKNNFEELRDLQTKLSECRELLNSRDEAIVKLHSEISSWKEKVEVESNRLKKVQQKLLQVEKVEVQELKNRIISLTKMLLSKGDLTGEQLKLLDAEVLGSQGSMMAKSIALPSLAVKLFERKFGGYAMSIEETVEELIKDVTVKKERIRKRLMSLTELVAQREKYSKREESEENDKLRARLRQEIKRAEELSEKVLDLEAKIIEDFEKHTKQLQEVLKEREKLMMELLAYQRSGKYVSGASGESSYSNSFPDEFDLGPKRLNELEDLSKGSITQSVADLEKQAASFSKGYESTLRRAIEKQSKALEKVPKLPKEQKKQVSLKKIDTKALLSFRDSN